VPEAARTARQEDVLTVARRVLAEEGVEALTLGRIARELGIKTPSLYKHFASKRELEAVLIAEGFEAFTGELVAAGSTLEAFARAYRRFALERPQLYRLMTEGPLPRDLLPDGIEARAAAPLIGAVGDADRARAAWACVHGLVVLELGGRFPDDADLDGAWSGAVEAFTSSSS
jgi:AcrR family transcriptional regulator